MRLDKSGELIKKLKENNILVNDISAYPFSDGILKDTIRVTVLSGRNFIRLKKFFNDYK